MDGKVYLSNDYEMHRNYVRDRITNFAKVHNIDDEEDVEFWLNTFESFLHDAQSERIKYGNTDIPINIDESLTSIEDILMRKYG